ncbi:MAG: exodeoxyribonuclease VII large subunit [Myxococcaceae bacterium]|nr:exodeoxyribonuclease VII large subunit [Myxococcaceae bacterium]
MKKRGAASQGDLFESLAAAPAPVPSPVDAGASSPRPAERPRVPQPVLVTAPPAAPDTHARSALQPLPPKPQKVVLTVGQLTRQIKDTLERGFPMVTVRGEVSGFRGPNVRGHLYFALKDQDACIDARIWASLASRMKFKLRDGLEVVVDGSVDVYEPQGRYSLIVQRIEPAGEGALALAFQQLKERLMAEGLFGERRLRPPRPVPFLPRRIGVVTSVTGAALRDFLRVLHGRHPRLPVLVADARVQGDGAAMEVVRAIERLGRADVDVIVVTRGGGSIEDLWTFNDERVARAIFASPVPVVSAIGHEVDFTIADFVADLRAPTPSAAAERLAPVLRDLELMLRTHEGRLRKAIERRLLEARQQLSVARGRMGDPRRMIGQKRLHLSAQAERAARCARAAVRRRREHLQSLSSRLARQHPRTRLAHNRQELLKLAERLRAAVRGRLGKERQALAKLALSVERASPAPKLEAQRRLLSDRAARVQAAVREQLATERGALHGLAQKLDAMSPLAVLARGYSVTFRSADEHVVRSASEVKPGDALTIRLSPGGCTTLAECESIDATVTGVRGGGT